MTAFVTGGSGFLGKYLITELIKEGYKVKALARSPQSAEIVKTLGAAVVDGDVSSPKALLEGCTGVETVFHLAGKTTIEGKWEDFERDTVVGTRNTVEAAEKAGVKKFIYCSSESAVIGEKQLINIDEAFPYPEKPEGPYSKSKMMAEKLVIAANKATFQTIAVRPRLIWGKGDAVIGPVFAELIKNGKFTWVDGGDYLTSTTYVGNAVEGLICAAKNGKGGEIYHITDGKPQRFRDFITIYTAKFGADPSKSSSVPYWLVSTVAVWFKMVPKYAPKLMCQEVTVNDSKARREIGYKGKVSLEEGLKQMD